MTQEETDESPLILVVEDDPDISRTLTLRLEMNGLRVQQAFNAQRAVQMAKEVRPDLIIMDVSMPGGDGFQVADELAEEESTTGLPVIFLTASMRPGLPGRALKAGAAAFLRKPYDARVLIDEVKRLTGIAG